MSQQSMLIIKSSWNNNETFKLIPVTSSCPYIECLYDPESKVFVVISKDKKTSLHMLPKLDDNGDPQRLKTKSATGRMVKEERKTIETFQEYYIEDHESMKTIINFMAVNPDFDIDKFLNSQSV